MTVANHPPNCYHAPMQQPPIKTWRQRLRPWHILLLVLLAFAVSFFAYSWYQSYVTNKELKQLIAEIEASEPHWKLPDMEAEHKKLPISPGFLKSLAALPPGYRGWFGDDLLDRPDAIDFKPDGRDYTLRFPMKYFDILKERLSDPRMDALRNELATYTSETNDHQSPFENLAQAQQLRTLSNAIRDEMELAAHEGRWQMLVPLMRQQTRNANLCREAPQYIARLISIACYANGLSGLYRAFALGTLPDAVLLDLQTILEKQPDDDLQQLIKLLRAEHHQSIETISSGLTRTQFIEFYHSRMKGGWSADISMTDKAFSWWNLLHAEMELLKTKPAQLDLLKLHQHALALTPHHPKEVMELYKAAGTSMQRPLTAFFAGPSQKLVSACLSVNMCRHAAIVGIASERYRLAKGYWPTSMNDLVPTYLKAIPTDPYSGKPLLYRVLSDGIVIYSVWFDGKDDGGFVLVDPVQGIKDKGFRLFNPELRGRRFEDVHSAK